MALGTAGMGGNACIISLNKTASQAFYLQGNGSVETTGCDIFVNSCHPVDALMGQGNTYIALSAEGGGATGKIYVCGEVKEQGPAYFMPEPSEALGEKNNPDNEADDPFASVDFPAFSSNPADCTYTNISSTDSDVTLKAGVYCGGITLTGGGSVTLDPTAETTPSGHPDGVFIIKDGEFSVAGNKTIFGENVTIFLTGSAANLDFGGTADIHLKAPGAGAGDYEGFVIFGDRDNPATSPHTMRGTPMGGYDGAIYLPETMVLMQGTAGVMSGYSSTCTMVVADKFNFLGTPNFEAQKSGCTGIPGGGGGGVSVKIVGQ